MLQSLLAILVLFFPLSEVALSISRRARGVRSSPADRGSLRLLWIVIVASVGCAAAFSEYQPMRIHASHRVVQAIALALLAGGLALRWTSVMFLGRYFTVNVTVLHDHRVVDQRPVPGNPTSQLSQLGDANQCNPATRRRAPKVDRRDYWGDRNSDEHSTWHAHG